MKTYQIEYRQVRKDWLKWTGKNQNKKPKSTYKKWFTEMYDAQAKARMHITSKFGDCKVGDSCVRYDTDEYSYTARITTDLSSLQTN